MTNNIRIFLWLGLALALWINYSQWQQDYAPKPTPAATATSTVPGTNPSVFGRYCSAGGRRSTLRPLPLLMPSQPRARRKRLAVAKPAAETAAGKVRVTTDVLVLDIDLKGGTLVRAELPGYPLVKGQPEPVILLNQDSPTSNYSLQTGLVAPEKTAGARPTHVAMFASAADKYVLAAGQNELRVPLTWTDGNAITVTKTFVFHRGMFAIGLEQSIRNDSAAPWAAASYARISRVDPKLERSMFKVESFAYRVPAIYDPSGKKYQKLDIEKTENQNLSLKVQNGWLAGIQHHFTTAIVPDPTKTYAYTLRAEGRHYILGALGPSITVAPGATVVLKEGLFVGPKLQKQLETLHPELSRVADYGLLTPLSKPLFWLLGFLHSLVKNWGFAIILATFLLKLAFYPLSEKAGRSMARMRALAPRMKLLQETYKDDRSKLGQATMELYKTEKVNPLAGCLPMIIQMPVFLAFYWVLLESAEMRQAPFFGWINDLSSRDPFFILPALNGLAMWLQYKLNPPPPDPMQAKIFQFMPLVILGDVRAVPGRPRAVLGHEHRVVDPAAVEHQSENRDRGQGAAQVVSPLTRRSASREA